MSSDPASVGMQTPDSAPEASRPAAGPLHYVLGALVVLAVLGCAGFVGLGYWLGGQMVRDDTEAEHVRAAARQMLDLAIPPALQPDVLVDVKRPLTDRRVMCWAVFRDAPEKSSGTAASSLVLAAIGEELAGVGPDELRVRLEQSLAERHQKGFEPLVDGTTSRHARSLNGNRVVFELVEGRSATSGKPRVEARGFLPGRFGLAITPPNPTASRPPELNPLPGKSGPVLVLFNADPKTFPKPKLVELIDSIALPGPTKQ